MENGGAELGVGEVGDGEGVENGSGRGCGREEKNRAIYFTVVTVHNSGINAKRRTLHNWFALLNYNF